MELDQQTRHLAEHQHSLVAVRQLRSMGASNGEIRWMRDSGEWDPLSLRVLRLVGGPRTIEQPGMALVLDTGPGSGLSYFTAAVHWAVPGLRANTLEASRQQGRTARTTLGYLHDPRYLPESHLTVVRGVPVATLPRTLFDVASKLTVEHMVVLVDRIGGKSPGILPVLHNMLPEMAEHGRNGITVMRKVLKKRPLGYKFPQSGLERRFEKILVDGGEPAMERQVDVGGHEYIGRVDFIDWDLLIVTEVDSILFHTAPSDVARDQERDEKLLAAGFRKVLRVSEEEIWYRPWEALRNVRDARAELRRRSAA